MKFKHMVATAALFATLGLDVPVAAQTPRPEFRYAVVTPNDPAPQFVQVVRHRRRHRRYYSSRYVVRRRSRRKSAAIVAGSAAGGAAIGALAGGGKGAAIGALAGGGAGYVYDRMTHKKVIRRY